MEARTINFIIFISVVMAVHISVNLYIGVRGWQALHDWPHARVLYAPAFVFLAVSFFAGRILERFLICRTSDILIWIGSFWFGMMLYLFLGALLCDLARLINHFAGFIPAGTPAYARARTVAAASVVGLTLVLMMYGWWNSLNPRIRTLVVEAPKACAGREAIDIALVSDIHLGTIIKNSRLQTMVDMVNVIQPDIVLLAGDIVDEDLKPVIANNLGELLRTIRSRLGTYAVTGNHEYIGGVEEACRYLEAHGVRMLRDQAVIVDGCLCLAGREDASIAQFSGRRRKPVDEILKGVDRTLPIILMDHQPIRLEEAKRAGVDLVVSGHTHHGQLWPGSIVTSLIFRVSYGFMRDGESAYYVSCGFGTWGPPVRIGTRPEVVHLQIRFKKGG